jgi:D-glycero-D-manno-heptose 1,7-bisphosphate phosphatase
VTGNWVLPAGRGPLALESVGQAAHADERPAVFLDRDGVLNEGVRDPDSGLFESPLKLADVRLLPGVAGAVRRLADAGYVLVCVSNQPVAAKGKTSVQELLALHERVLELLEQQGAHLDASRLCPHHPDGVVDELSGPCDCRKPAAGMLLDAARAQRLDLQASWMLGDTDSDVQAGQAAGCRTVLIEYPPSAHKRRGEARPDLRAADLADGVAQLLAHDSPGDRRAHHNRGADQESAA